MGIYHFWATVKQERIGTAAHEQQSKKYTGSNNHSIFIHTRNISVYSNPPLKSAARITKIKLCNWVLCLGDKKPDTITSSTALHIHTRSCSASSMDNASSEPALQLESRTRGFKDKFCMHSLTHRHRGITKVWLRKHPLSSWGTANSCQDSVARVTPSVLPWGRGCHTPGKASSHSKIASASLPPETSLLLPPQSHEHPPLHPSPQTGPPAAALPVPSNQEISMATAPKRQEETAELDWKPPFCSCLHHVRRMGRRALSLLPQVRKCVPASLCFSPGHPRIATDAHLTKTLLAGTSLTPSQN